jgi:hypothetical protein
MTVRLVAAALAVSLGALAVRAQDHPYKNVKVDDFVTYKVNLSVGALKLDGTATQTVVKKDDKEVTVRVVANYSGVDAPAQEQKIDLTKPYDPTKVGPLQPGSEAKIDKVKDEKAKVKYGKDNKEVECVLTTYKVKAKTAGQDIDAEVKVWESKDVPLGMVRVQLDGTVGGMKAAMTMELLDAGVKKTP